MLPRLPKWAQAKKTVGKIKINNFPVQHKTEILIRLFFYSFIKSIVEQQTDVELCRLKTDKTLVLSEFLWGGAPRRFELPSSEQEK